MATPRNAGFGANFLIGAASFLLAGALVLVWFKWFSPVADSDEAKRSEMRMLKADTVRKAGHTKLNGYAWIDQKAGVVQLPIERAMELALVDLKNKKVGASAVKVEMPYPIGLSAPAAAAAPQAAPAANSKGAPAASPAPTAAPTTPKVEPPKAPAASTPTAPQPAPAAAIQPAPAPATAPKPATPATPISSEQKSSDLKK